jgi:hypothetical protein
MNLFIQIINGAPINHPLTVDNLLYIFPQFDGETPPDGYAKFERTSKPVESRFEITEGPVYSLIDGIVKEVWSVRQMTEEEKTSFVNALRSMDVPEGCVFDETLLDWVKVEVPVQGSAPNVIG